MELVLLRAAQHGVYEWFTVGRGPGQPAGDIGSVGLIVDMSLLLTPSSLSVIHAEKTLFIEDVADNRAKTSRSI
jgi:hypothetical protein